MTIHPSRVSQKIPVPELRVNDKDDIVELAVVMGKGTCPDIVEYYGSLIREVSLLYTLS